MYILLKGAMVMIKNYDYSNSRKNLCNSGRKKHMTATVQKWGNSQGIRLPKYILDAIKWKENEQLDLSIEDDKIIIEKISKPERKNIKELFANFNDEYHNADIDWGNPVGNEIW